MQEGKDAKEGKKHNAYGASWLCPVQERIESRAAQVVLEKKNWFQAMISYKSDKLRNHDIVRIMNSCNTFFRALLHKSTIGNIT